MLLGNGFVIDDVISGAFKIQTSRSCIGNALGQVMEWTERLVSSNT
jgi:hypothetical protein